MRRTSSTLAELFSVPDTIDGLDWLMVLRRDNFAGRALSNAPRPLLNVMSVANNRQAFRDARFQHPEDTPDTAISTPIFVSKAW